MQRLNPTKISCSCFYFWRSVKGVKLVKGVNREAVSRSVVEVLRGLGDGADEVQGQKARMSQRELDKVLCQIKEKCRQEEGRVPSDPPPVAWILDHSGHLALQVAPDQKCYTFGRNYDCDVVLKDRAVSRYHVRLEVGREKMAIELISTTNSMVVNGTYVASPDQYR